MSKKDHFGHFSWTFVNSKGKRSSLRSQCWMRRFSVIFKYRVVQKSKIVKNCIFLVWKAAFSVFVLHNPTFYQWMNEALGRHDNSQFSRYFFFSLGKNSGKNAARNAKGTAPRTLLLGRDQSFMQHKREENNSTCLWQASVDQEHFLYESKSANMENFNYF